jgi:hypothetical protein
MADRTSAESPEVQDKILEMMGVNKNVETPVPAEGTQLTIDSVPEPQETPVAVEEESTPVEGEEEATGVVEEASNEAKPEGEATEPSSEEKSEEGSEDVINEDGIIDDWDKTPEGEFKESTQLDYQALGNELGLEIKSEDDLKTTLSELKTKNEELSVAADNYSKIPDQLKAALDFAEDGGDWRAMLDIEAVDYSKVNPIDLYIRDTTELFRDEQGQINDEKLNNFLDGVTDEQMEIEGKRLQRGLMRDQELKRNELRVAAENKRIQEDQRLKEALKNFDKVADYAVSQEHKQKLYNDLSSGKALNRLFYDSKGDFDYNKIVKNAFIADKFEQMVSHSKNMARTEKTREVIKDLSNNTVAEPKKEPVTPDITPPDPMDLMLKAARESHQPDPAYAMLIEQMKQ